MTVIQKIERAVLLTSYSYRGKYYTLDEIANFDIDPHTVAKERPELLYQDFIKDRIRKKSGGRISIEKKSPKS